jgi:lipoic acid synthetase
MIGGDICTRSCRFCNTQTGKPLPLDALEPQHVADSILVMGLRYAVVTSVDRDDLADLGAGHWVETIKSVKKVNPNTTLETLIPDFQGRMELIDAVIQAQPDVISHNLETVSRLSPMIRSAARYETSLEVLAHTAKCGIPTKTGIMVGLGETAQEVEQLMDDARHVGVQIITIGQYLQPSRKHIPVTEYVLPQQFEAYRQMALSKGFGQVMSAPLVRSSYHADQASI